MTVNPSVLFDHALGYAVRKKRLGALGLTQGARFQAFCGCMYFSMMRPSEVAALTLSACELPDDGWAWLRIADASTTAGRACTDDGQAHEHRGLQGPHQGQAGYQGAQAVPAHPGTFGAGGHAARAIVRFGVGPDGRVFRSDRGSPVNASTWWQVWQKVRAASLKLEQLDGPLMRRPYDLRHADVTWRHRLASRGARWHQRDRRHRR